MTLVKILKSPNEDEDVVDFGQRPFDDISFGDLQNLILLAFYKGAKDEHPTHLMIKNNDQFFVAGSSYHMIEEALKGLIEKRYIEGNQNDYYSITHNGIEKAEKFEKIDCYRTIGSNFEIIFEDNRPHQWNVWIGYPSNEEGLFMIPASNRMVAPSDNDVDQIRELIAKAKKELPSAELTNEENSQAMAQLDAADTLANAPNPPWETIKNILEPLAQIVTIASFILAIMVLI